MTQVVTKTVTTKITKSAVLAWYNDPTQKIDDFCSQYQLPNDEAVTKKHLVAILEQCGLNLTERPKKVTIKEKIVYGVELVDDTVAEPVNDLEVLEKVLPELVSIVGDINGGAIVGDINGGATLTEL